ncbi:MAG: AMP-binding protein [Oscillospiraceae bacterium]|nr:AMP-binding protein [Oscillospiraceae bacterium]
MHNLIEFLEETCNIWGSCAAVDADDGTLSFNELRDAALRVAGHIVGIRGRSCEKKMIAVYMAKGAKCLCAMLGVLYSGNIYVPMDCRAPINRTKLIVDIIKPVLVITDAKGMRMLADAGVSADIIVDYDNMGELALIEHGGLVTATLENSRDVDPAYVLFTSGSTGVPKGVVIPHRRVINYINWARDCFSISSEEIIGNQAPFYFTVSAMDIFLCLATGSKLCIIPEGLFSKPDKLLHYLQEHDVTLVFWVSSVYNHIAQAKALDGVGSLPLRRAWFVGEPMAVQSLQYWMNGLHDVEFVNMYGATETDMTIFFRVPKGVAFDGGVPLGKPCANTDILLLNDDGGCVDQGEIGEICVRGSCLALGYFSDFEKTQRSFVQNPLHKDYIDVIYRTGDLGELREGLILFHGRRDHQFKHLGYRIEAGEIEAIAAKFPGIKNVCVLYDGERRQIALFYDSDEVVDEIALRRALMADLPVYMVPTRFIRLDAMPFNANKKKDRIALRKRYLESGD